MANDSVSYSWFAVFNNPHEHGYPFENNENPAELLKRDENSFKSQVRKLLEKLRDEWISVNNISLSDNADTTGNDEKRTGAWVYCISANGLHHVHMVLCSSRAMRWSKVKKVYCQGMNFSSTKGTKKEADDYINKRGKFAEKGEIVIDTIYHGEIHSNQGHRSDLDRIQELLDEGKHPDEIISMSIRYARLKKCIRDYYLAKKNKDVKLVNPDTEVHWLYGDTGTGKTHTYIELCEQYGENNVYWVTDYEHPFDDYFGEDIIFFDEFRGNIRYSSFLNYIDKYKCKLPCRYSNSTKLYSKIYISSPLLPQEAYSHIFENGGHDSIKQLMRRINDITYFYKHSGNYYTKRINVKNTEIHERYEFNVGSSGEINNINDITSLIGNLEDYAPILS